MSCGCEEGRRTKNARTGRASMAEPRPGGARMRGDPSDLAVAHLVDEVVQRLGGARIAASIGRRGGVLALHHHGRHAFDLVLVSQLRGAFGIGAHAEAVVGIQELFAVHPVGGHEIGDLIRLRHRAVVLVQLVEHAVVQRLAAGVLSVELAQRFQRVIDAAMRLQLGIEGDRHALDHHILALLGDPGRPGVLEVVAVRAAVPEELRDFDLACGHRLRRLQHFVFLAGGGRGIGRCGHQEAGAGGQCNQESSEFFHGEWKK